MTNCLYGFTIAKTKSALEQLHRSQTCGEVMQAPASQVVRQRAIVSSNAEQHTSSTLEIEKLRTKRHG